MKYLLLLVILSIGCTPVEKDKCYFSTYSSKVFFINRLLDHGAVTTNDSGDEEYTMFDSMEYFNEVDCIMYYDRRFKQRFKQTKPKT